MRFAKYAAALLLFCSFAMGDPGKGQSKSIRAVLNGYQETPAVSTTGHGTFKAKVDPSNAMMEYTLSFEDLESPVRMAHIHFGARGTSGGVMIWLCGTAAFSGPAGTPVCPVSGSVGGVVGASDIGGPAGQGIAAGEWDEALKAVRAGVAYVNVHSDMWPGGEIRGQVNDEDGK